MLIVGPMQGVYTLHVAANT